MSRSGQKRVAIIASGSALLVLSAHVAAKAARDALFLSHFPATDLPPAMMGAAIISLLSALAMSWAMGRRGPTVVVSALFFASGALFAAEWGLIGRAPKWVAVLLYLHFAAASGLLISGFWSVVSEHFDPHSAKTPVARISGFAALGGVVGGVLASQISARSGLAALLPVLAGLHGLCAIALAATGTPRRGAAQAVDDRSETRSGWQILRHTPLLAQMAGLIAVLAVLEALLDYALKAEVADHLSGEALIQFFAGFYTLIGLLAFGLQTAAGERGLRRMGLGGAMALLPAAVALSGTLASALTRLWTVAIVRGLAFALSTTLFKAGFELLYTPVPANAKRRTKSFIDVGSQRVGDMIGGALIFALLLAAPALPTRLLLVIAVAAAGLALWLVVRLHRGYVDQLADRLRDGALSLSETEPLDATTARTLAATQQVLDRAELLERIRELQASREDAAAPSPPEPTEARLAELFQHISALESGDRARIRAALVQGGGDARLLPHVVPLLRRFDVSDEVMAFLRELAPRAVGQLTDALVDRTVDKLIRRRLPGALEACPGRRALGGLTMGLEDPDFTVRLECARSAARMIAERPELSLPQELVHERVERELRIADTTWEQQGRRSSEESGETTLGGKAVPSNLEYVFTILSLAYGPELMSSSLRGILSGDSQLRGTALEYLEVTLPQPLCQALWGRIPGANAYRPGAARDREQLVDELLRAGALLGSSARTR